MSKRKSKPSKPSIKAGALRKLREAKAGACQPAHKGQVGRKSP